MIRHIAAVPISLCKHRASKQGMRRAGQDKVGEELCRARLLKQEYRAQPEGPCWMNNLATDNLEQLNTSPPQSVSTDFQSELLMQGLSSGRMHSTHKKASWHCR